MALLKDSNDYKRKRFLMKWTTYIGSYLLNFWTQVPWIWGNLSAYTFSYFRTLGLSSCRVSGPWMASTFLISWSIGMMLSEKVFRRFNRRGVVLVSLLISNGGMFLSYFTVQVSPRLLNLTLGGMTGVGSGLVFSMQQVYVIEWTEKYVGLATASVQAMVIFFTVLSNAAVTLLINPTNLQPDRFNGHATYFSQKEIIDRVPTFFLLFASANLLVNLTGLALVRDRPKDDAMLTMAPNYSEKMVCCQTCKYEQGTIDSSKSCYSVQDSSDHSPGNKSEESPLSSSKKVNDDDDASDESNFTPGQVLKASPFYVLAISTMVADASFITLTTYYKTFGSLYIKNDHFLSTIGTLTCLAVATLILVFGGMSDRMGLKTTSVSASFMMAVLTSFYFFTPMLSKWLFLLFTVMGCGLVFGFYNLTMIGTLRIFGPRHFTTNYGMVSSSSLLINVVMPPVTEFVIVNYGWVYLYFSIALINFPTLLLIVFGLPRV